MISNADRSEPAGGVAVDLEDFWTGPWSTNNVIAQPARDSYRYYGARLTASF